MELESVSLIVSNLIKKPCKNFLSYLYKYNGWKRAVLGTSKECFIPSYVEDKEIRILISEQKIIYVKGCCFTDILKAFEFIEEQFKYGKIDTYLDSVDMNIKTNYVYNLDLEVYDIWYDNVKTLSEPGIKIVLDEDFCEIKIADQDKLSEAWIMICEETSISRNPVETIEMNESISGYGFAENVVVGSILSWIVAKLGSCWQ